MPISRFLSDPDDEPIGYYQTVGSEQDEGTRHSVDLHHPQGPGKEEVADGQE